MAHTPGNTRGSVMSSLPLRQIPAALLRRVPWYQCQVPHKAVQNGMLILICFLIGLAVSWLPAMDLKWMIMMMMGRGYLAETRRRSRRVAVTLPWQNPGRSDLRWDHLMTVTVSVWRVSSASHWACWQCPALVSNRQTLAQFVPQISTVNQSDNLIQWIDDY